MIDFLISYLFWILTIIGAAAIALRFTGLGRAKPVRIRSEEEKTGNRRNR